MDIKYDLQKVESSWLKHFNDPESKSIIDTISEKFISDLSNKCSNFLEITLKNKLQNLGCYFNDDDFYDFIKNKVTKICPYENSNVYEFILDFDEKSRSGVFLFGIIERQNFSNFHENSISSTIIFESYSKSKILKSV